MKWNPLNNSIGLALGGGGAKGVAHIGVLKAYEEASIQIDYIAGTSIGAIVASYYAFGKSSDDLKAIGESLNFNAVLNWSWQRMEMGAFTTDAIKKRILEDLGEVNIEDAQIPLAICTTDLLTGKSIVLREGSLTTAVCASMAIPGFFAPVEFQGMLLVDGGITQNVPVSALNALGAGIRVAVDLNGISHYPVPKNALSVMSNAIDIAIDSQTRAQVRQADVVISMDLSEYSRINNRERFAELYDTGYDAAKKSLDKLKLFKQFSYVHYLSQLTRASWPLKIPLLLRHMVARLLKTE
jgi:NTE family protein